MRPGVGRLLADDHPEQRRLAGPVGADDPDDPGLRQREAQVLDEDPVAVALAQALDLDDRVAETRSGRDGDLELAVGSLVGVRLGQQLLVGTEARLALGLPSPRRQAHPLELAGEGALAGVGRALLPGEPSQLLFQPARVVALERDAAAAVELEDPLRDVVEEIAVVGDRHDRPRVFLEEALEPVDRLGVEVVGRLVEQQQVGVAEEEPGERHAALLPAGQLRDVGVVGRAAQGVHRDVDVAFEVPGIGRGDLVLERGLLGADGLVVGVGVGPGGHDRVVLVDERLDLGDAVHDVALDVLGRIELGLLAQVADGEAGCQAGFTGEPVVEPGHDPQQARLAGAVRTDDADLGARVERDRDVLEDRLVGRVVPGELVGRVDEFVGHVSRVTGGACPRRRRSPFCQWLPLRTRRSRPPVNMPSVT